MSYKTLPATPAHDFGLALRYFGVIIALFAAVLGALWLARFLVPAVYSNWLWMLAMLVMLCVIGLAGRFVSEDHRWLAFFVNKEKRLSFSRLQVLCWWVMLLSALVVVLNARYAALSTSSNWHNLTIPTDILAAAGLSTATAVATAFINSAKRNPDSLQASNLATRYPPASTPQPSDRNGYLKIAQGPSLKQLFTGSEVGNCETLDWAKTQALLLTAILLAFYGMAIWSMLSDTAKLLADSAIVFPDFSSTLATLLTISLAGFAGNKIADHSTTDI